MSNNRTRSMAAAKKGKGTGPAKAPNASAAATNTAQQSGTNANPSDTAASRRYAERQARKQQVALEAKRTRNRRYAIFTIALVICIVAVLVIVKVTSGGGGSSGGVNQSSPPGGTPIPAATLAKLGSVPMSTLNAAPTGGLINAPQTVSSPALTANGKPEILFVGAEWCPHCAAERWALYVALSKFGTFSPQPGQIHSATRDGNVPTLTFYGTTYSSPYLSFVPVEVFTNHPSGNSYTPLQTLTPSQQQLWQKYGGTFPFVDFGGKQVLSGAQYSYADLQNLHFSAVAAQVGDNSTTIGANINASAAQLVKTICGSLTHGQPANVCSP